MRERFHGVVIITAVVVIGALAALYFTSYSSTRGTVITTVRDKDQVCDYDFGRDKYECVFLVFTDDGTFQIEGDLFTNYKSLNIYGSIKRGRTYEFTVQGWRSPSMGWHPFITSEPKEIPQ